MAEQSYEVSASGRSALLDNRLLHSPSSSNEPVVSTILRGTAQRQKRAGVGADNNTHQQDATCKVQVVSTATMKIDNAPVAKTAGTDARNLLSPSMGESPTSPAKSTSCNPAICNPYAISSPSTSASTNKSKETVKVQHRSAKDTLATNRSTVDGSLPPAVSHTRQFSVNASTSLPETTSVQTKTTTALDGSAVGSSSRPDPHEGTNPYKRKRKLQGETTMLSKKITTSPWRPVVANPYSRPAKRPNTNEPLIEGLQFPDDSKKQVTSSKTTNLPHAQSAVRQGAAEPSSFPHFKATSSTPHSTTPVAPCVLRNPYLQQSRSARVSTPEAASVSSTIGTIIRNPYQTIAAARSASAKRPLWNNSG